MKVIVVGCGRQGACLARLLNNMGHDVTVIDDDEGNFQRLQPGFKGKTIQAIAFDRQALLKAGIERADSLAAVTNNDDANIVTALLARSVFRVPHVVARVYDPRQRDIYGRLGLQMTSPIELGAAQIVHLLVGGKLDRVLTLGNGELDIVQTEVTSALVGRQVNELTLSNEISVIAVTRHNRAFIPSLGTRLENGDLLHISVTASAANRLEQLLGL